MTGMLSRLTPPSQPLLTVAAAQAQCRVTSPDEHALIADYVGVVSDYLDAQSGVLGEALVTQTWRLTFSAAPGPLVDIPLGPVQSIAAISYVDVAGAAQVVPSANYRLVGNVVELVDGAAWPVVDARLAAFWIDFVAGYGMPAEVPQTVRQLARLMVADLYENRQATGDQSAQMSEAFKSLMASARSHRGMF